MPLVSAELMLRALQFGRRRFVLPLDPEVAVGVLDRGRRLAEELNQRIEEVMSHSSLGGKYQGQVRERILSILLVDLDGLLATTDKNAWDIVNGT